MPRVRIDLPESYVYQTEIPVRIGDVNYGGHLGNDALLSLIHEARVRMFKHFGYTELNVEGTSIIMSDVAIVYKSEGFYGDNLRFEIAVADPQRVGCDIVYRISQAISNREVARAKTGIVFFNYETRKLQDIPRQFLERVMPNSTLSQP